MRLSSSGMQLTAAGSNGTAQSDAAKTPRRKKSRRGPKPKPVEVRNKLKADEFRVDAIVNHWPRYYYRPSASWYLIRFEEGIQEDHWSKEIDVSNDLLDEYWERRGLENREFGVEIEVARKEAAKAEAELERAAAEEAEREEAAMRQIAEKKVAAEMKKMRAARRK